MDKEQLFKDALMAQRQRVTSPRLSLFRILLRKSPLSTNKLIEEAAKFGIDQATCYRNLILFRNINLVSDLVIDGQRMVELNESFAGHHHHFWCKNCGKLIDFDDAALELSIGDAGRRLGVLVTGHQLEVSGLCETCQALT